MVYDKKGLQTMNDMKWNLKNPFFVDMAPLRLYLLDWKAFIFFEKDNKNNEKKPTLKNEKKANKPVSIRFNLQRSLTKRRLGLLHDAKEKLTAV